MRWPFRPKKKEQREREAKDRESREESGTPESDNLGAKENRKMSVSELAQDALESGSTLQHNEHVYRLEKLINERANIQWWRADLGSVENDHSTTVLVKLEFQHSAEKSVLETEYQAISSIEDSVMPNIVDFFTDNGNTGLAIAWPFGIRLTDAIEDEEINRTQGFSTLVSVCRAIRKLHDAGWVHLGLTPDNIIIGEETKLISFDSVCAFNAEPMTVELSDFSAPELEAAGNNSTVMEHCPICQSENMDANERCRSCGASLVYHNEITVDGREDIYSIGAILGYVVDNTKPTSIYQFGTADSLNSHTEHSIPNSAEKTDSDDVSELGKVRAPGVAQVLENAVVPRDKRMTRAEGLLGALRQAEEEMKPRFLIQAAFDSSIGINPHRTTNEDAFGYLEREYAFESKRIHYGFYCLADGMGGMEAGEVASQAAVSAALDTADREAFALAPDIEVDTQEQVTREVVYQANQAVCNQAADYQRGRMGTTFTCAFLIGRRLTIGHVGDSRMYLLRDNDIRLLSEDHTMAALLVNQGELDPDDVPNHPDRNKLTKSLGDPDLTYKKIATLRNVMGQTELTVNHGDVIVLCSDGAWDLISDDELQQRIHAAGDVLESIHELIQTALVRGGKDNITVGMIKVQALGPYGIEG